MKKRIPKANFELKPKKEFFESFPDYKGRKMSLVRWTRSDLLLVSISGNSQPGIFSPAWFKGFGKNKKDSANENNKIQYLKGEA